MPSGGAPELDDPAAGDGASTDELVESRQMPEQPERRGTDILFLALGFHGKEGVSRRR
jgi:hypothetical protein